MRLLRIVLIVAGLLVLAVGAVAAILIGPRNIVGMLRYDQRREGELKVGDPAPDVALVGLDGTSSVHLREHIGGKPLVLIFGSYT